MKHPDLMTAVAALRDQTAHVTQRLYGRIIFALGVGGAEFPRPCTGRDRRQKQPTSQYCGPPNAGAAIHWQPRPPVMVSATGKKGSSQFGRSSTIAVPGKAIATAVVSMAKQNQYRLLKVRFWIFAHKISNSIFLYATNSCSNANFAL